ncbi:MULTISPECIES: alpha-glucuronidase family glycosyl hydrolase [Paenibacillus]|uniref:alpha-glucuronidase family glycosyl hydrolase n=1 Tax=Paenibacillus TaxID=44249 RepID=UPI0022B90AB9|nr:alpha-glucuronidase family glycosyl hydrolase [Paenibacillus caseinilyticus]MCZ8523944.1 alpha-glucuronidase family glycosyl hydrolase [Paenibacillus caseinilyticus]
MNANGTGGQAAGYDAWLGTQAAAGNQGIDQAGAWFGTVTVTDQHEVTGTASAEWCRAVEGLYGINPSVLQAGGEGTSGGVLLGTFGSSAQLDEAFGPAAASVTGPEGFAIRADRERRRIAVGAKTPAGVLYGVFHLLRLLRTGASPEELNVAENPAGGLRMINQWDNMDGSIERGYAGRSIFYDNNRITENLDRIRDYARLLASTGINAITVNNVNVHRHETKLLTQEYLPDVAKLAAVFRAYAIKLFLSINYASPLEIGGLSTADPLDPGVRAWWRSTAADVYAAIPDFGGFLVKADSENRPGPFTYGRDHADGSNMLAEALQPYGGIMIWRCFVYNCKQDWRDRQTDRARAAYDHFKPLDGRFLDNVILQIKNGPMDFQVREPVSPLFGGLAATNQVIEFQITQEYTGQQRHLCYLVPQWKEVLDFDTYALGEGSTVRRIVDGTLFGSRHSGFAAVSNIGGDANWTGHLLAQANLYGFGRLAWNPGLSAEDIAGEWIRLTFGSDERVVRTVMGMLMDSWSIYESYTAPLGVGWMVNPDHHYGPNVDGYEYSKWGTYHFADCHGIGVDRTVASGTGYTAQYKGSHAAVYESLADCPDELLLFFHHVPYTHKLHSGRTVIQHIYDTHFEGVERADHLKEAWAGLAGAIPEGLHAQVAERLSHQAEHAREWRDIINTYFYRKSGIADEQGRTIH